MRPQPADMNEERLAQCLTDLSRAGLADRDRLEQSFRRLIFQVKGRATVALPDIAGPRKRETPRKNQWADLAPMLRAEIDSIAVAPVNRGRGNKKSTVVITVRNRFLRAIAAATAAGHSIAVLRDLATDDVLKSVISHPWFGPADQPNQSRSLLLEALRRFAYDYLNDETLGDRLDLLLQRFPKRTSELNGKGITSAHLFDNLETLVLVKAECRRIVAELIDESADGQRIDPSQTAIAICLLIETAIMPRSATSARFCGPPHPGGARPTLVSDDPRGMALEDHLTLRTIKMVDDYYTAFIAHGERPAQWLFEHLSFVGRKSACSFSGAVARLGKRLNLKLTPSALRLSAINLVIRSVDLDPKELKEITRTNQTINFVTRYGPLIRESQRERCSAADETEVIEI